jgi:hypothetical protein
MLASSTWQMAKTVACWMRRMEVEAKLSRGTFIERILLIFILLLYCLRPSMIVLLSSLSGVEKLGTGVFV